MPGVVVGTLGTLGTLGQAARGARASLDERFCVKALKMYHFTPRIVSAGSSVDSKVIHEKRKMWLNASKLSIRKNGICM